MKSFKLIYLDSLNVPKNIPRDTLPRRLHMRAAKVVQEIKRVGDDGFLVAQSEYDALHDIRLAMHTEGDIGYVEGVELVEN